MNGAEPARLADAVIDELKSRERSGLVVLSDAIHITGGALMGMAGLYSGMRGADRVAVLLGVLGTAVLPAADIESAG
jgi:hypothetical protein